MLFENKLLVERSRDPECDAARALLAKGITGKLVMQDRDGRPLCVIDIERAAKVTSKRMGAVLASSSSSRGVQIERPAPKSHR